jgi:hypothetical protein
VTLHSLNESRPSDTEGNRFLHLCRSREYADAAAELARIKFRVQYSQPTGSPEWKAWCDAAGAYLANKAAEVQP